jgi:5-methyltetrahydrofolate--homocysteine methyltransferase
MVVGLAMDEDGIPPTVQGRLQAAGILVETACKYGVDARDLYLDPLVMPVGVGQSSRPGCLKYSEGFQERVSRVPHYLWDWQHFVRAACSVTPQ